MKCQRCQAQLSPQARFCPHCGAIVEETESPAAEEDTAVEEVKGQEMESGTTSEDATLRVSPEEMRAMRAWQQTLKDQSGKLTTPEQPLTESDSNVLHHNASAPLPQEATKPGQYTAELPTVPVSISSITHPELHTPDEQPAISSQAALSPFPQAAPLLYYKLNTTTKGSQMLPAVINSAYSQGEAPRRRRSKGGCILGCLTTLVLLLIIIGAGWIFILRPYAHNIAQTELDKAMTSAVDQMPSSQLTQLLPPGSTLPINESTINNLIVLNLAPSNPVQKPETSITPQRVRIAFQVYGYPSAISMVPTLDSSGHLVANDVNVEGVLGLIESPDELKPMLDKHLSDAQNKLGRSIKAVKLDNQQLTFTL
ncbi:hypothetical protein KDH_56840 [Dictyobacter sp. S3.2.2.5]|uniref:Zinc-ribbon domain-containing protein n=1 Tax=Dictyobacter halimunensis TaxID=3026934 RepID=A0ABQ6G014_9CHLR|nr:hypothetical protein KDH_56840 [Dictyobacter sp. S3.2.2.5]